jgi:hypothetical protein
MKLKYLLDADAFSDIVRGNANCRMAALAYPDIQEQRGLHRKLNHGRDHYVRRSRS